MREQLEKRVAQLKAEQQAGEQMLAELEANEASLRQTLLRISGAIQVLEELLAAEPTAANGGQDSAPQPSHPSSAAAAAHPRAETAAERRHQSPVPDQHDDDVTQASVDR